MKKRKQIFVLLFFCIQYMVALPNHFEFSDIGIGSKTSARCFVNSVTAFEENKGQVKGFDGSNHPEVRFTMSSGNTRVFILENGIAYQFTKTHYPEGYLELESHPDKVGQIDKLLELQKQVRTETFRMDMILVGANRHCEITTEVKSDDYTNYYKHNVLEVHSFSKIIYHDIYPGIDWVIYTQGKESDGYQMKYDFVVKPGAEPSHIQMQFKHQEKALLNKDGTFTIKNILGSITEQAPFSFQAKRKIQSKFVFKNQTLQFALGKYDENKALVIDPSVIWATYYGGSDGDLGLSCAYDAPGNVYLAGYTQSLAGIAIGGHQNTIGAMFDAFLVKFNSSGLRQWATYYGGITRRS